MLVKTAEMSKASPADVFGIQEHEIAFAFNVECADIQNQWEQEREFEKEKRQLELLTGQKIATEFGGIPQAENKGSVERW